MYAIGSEHSVTSTPEMFPRRGGCAGFYPLLNPRLISFTLAGLGEAPQPLWLERKEQCVEVCLWPYSFYSKDCIIVFSHDSLNTAPVKITLAARGKDVTVVALTPLRNYNYAEAAHSSGEKLASIADLTIGNFAPPEDALVEINAFREKVAVVSPASTTAITMALVVETAGILSRRGKGLQVLMSPNITKDTKPHNREVFEAY